MLIFPGKKSNAAVDIFLVFIYYFANRSEKKDRNFIDYGTEPCIINTADSKKFCANEQKKRKLISIIHHPQRRGIC